MLARLIGGLLMGAGLLIAGGSGLCSLLLLAEGSTWAGPSAAESLSIIAMVGGIPFVIGIGLFFTGRLVWRKGDSDQPPGTGAGG